GRTRPFSRRAGSGHRQAGCADRHVRLVVLGPSRPAGSSRLHSRATPGVDRIALGLGQPGPYAPLVVDRGSGGSGSMHHRGARGAIRILPAVRRRWPRHGWIVVALAVGVASPASAVTGKARELVVQADQLQAAPNASDESVQRAIAFYEEAARLEPNSAEIQVKLADAALTVAAWTSGDRLRWYQLGKTAAERAVALDQHDAE